jgi:hypothetical protein
MYVCLDCGKLYDEQPTIQERHGELDGNWYETLPDTCICGGNIEEAVQCKVCDDWYSEDDLVEGVCGYCLHRNLQACTVEEFIDTFEIEKCTFEINAALEHVFTSDEVNEILMREFKECLHKKRKLPSRLENAMNTYLQDTWAEFLTERSAENG